MDLETILDPTNLMTAWKAVRRNKGAAGVDGKSINATDEHLRRHWPAIRDKLLDGSYRPAAVRSVAIPKPNGGTRLLGIPTVQDRVIQQALLQGLQGVFDPEMSPHSYGFRPGRSAHDAIEAARSYVAQGKTWVADIDLKSYFDQVDHDRLMTYVGRKIRDKRILRLIGRYLRAPNREADGRHTPRTRGTPQGGPLSPLLANIYLDPLDKELEKRGIAFVRYADDIALFAASERSARRMLEGIKDWLRRELGLEVNDEKSGTGPSRKTQLLGFRIYPEGKVGIAPKAIEKLKTRVRELWDARQNKTTEELRDQWLSYIQGWWNYFRHADCIGGLRKWTGWIRRHMRKCFWQRWHNRKGRRNALQRLGIRGRGLGNASNRLGAWPMAKHVVVQQALKVAVLNRYGFIVPWDFAA